LYGAPAAMFQPGAEHRRDQQASPGAAELEAQLILPLPPVTLGREQCTNHLAARSLNGGEVVPRAKPAQQREGAQHEIANEYFHGSFDRREPVGTDGSMTALTIPGVGCRGPTSSAAPLNLPPVHDLSLLPTAPYDVVLVEMRDRKARMVRH